MEVGGPHHALLEITPVPSEYEVCVGPRSGLYDLDKRKRSSPAEIWTPGHLVGSLPTIRYPIFCWMGQELKIDILFRGSSCLSDRV